jgi:uncharacterized protein (DUF1330 family)
MPLQLCVLLWAVPGRDADLTSYEDAVLALLPSHGGRVVSRVRRIDGQPGPIEVQLIELPDDAALQAFRADPARAALAETRQAVVERTELIQVRVIE